MGTFRRVSLRVRAGLKCADTRDATTRRPCATRPTCRRWRAPSSTALSVTFTSTTPARKRRPNSRSSSEATTNRQATCGSGAFIVGRTIPTISALILDPIFCEKRTATTAAGSLPTSTFSALPARSSSMAGCASQARAGSGRAAIGRRVSRGDGALFAAGLRQESCGSSKLSALLIAPTRRPLREHPL